MQESINADLRAIGVGVAANVVYGVLVAVRRWSYSHLVARTPVSRRATLAILCGAWVLLNCGYFFYIHEYVYAFLAVSTIIFIWALYQELNQFWRIGLVGADAQISTGIDYIKALRMVSSSLDFLGIGASKLTANEGAFDEAIDRCDRRGRAIRFLLSSPENTELQNIARKAGKDQGEYQRKVRDSLRHIAHLKNERGKNIEVRFYKDFPAFRLMFIDEQICLTSHYVVGKGDGSQLPQLHILRKSASKDVDSLYYGFTEYFENIWAQSEEWNFHRYIDHA